MNAIRWVFFDIGSTLVDEEEAHKHRIRDMIEGTSVTLDQFWDKRIQYAKEGFTEIKRPSSISAYPKRPGTARMKLPFRTVNRRWLRSAGKATGYVENSRQAYFGRRFFRFSLFGGCFFLFLRSSGGKYGLKLVMSPPRW